MTVIQMISHCHQAAMVVVTRKRALETDDDEEDEEELSQKRKHYLKQRYSLQKVSVDGSNSHHSHDLSNSKSGNREKQNKMIPKELTSLKI